ncbi:Hypothetical protein, putative [Bodo saltans]|uniref:Scaffold protein Nfu/NifU N-terminal domain-containing protein n=1 Tax=Bodo saltans TaxID=75058 RepID=A0A0S4IJH0_BODSA|nr:Hypothetical protein, putative [Bodo saltans]|eukprot:CUE85688.1 Hypothetical protein, putative [Bodo saltans]
MLKRTFISQALRRFQTFQSVPMFPGAWFQGVRNYLIETSETPNPDCLRFFSMELSFLPPGQSMDMPNSGHSYKSPLAEALFAVDGVDGLYFADEYITVTKCKDSSWEDLTVQIQESVNSFAESKHSILSEDGEQAVNVSNDDTEPKPDDDEVVLAVKELLATRIRPMLRSDGGNVRYVGMDDGAVYVMLEGACKTCPSSGATLKNGIERMLMHWIPEVVEVLEIDEDFAEDFRRQEEEKKAAAKKAADVPK